MRGARWLAALAVLFPAAASATDVILWGLNLGPDSKGSQAVIREFERRHPGVRVRAMNMGAGGMDPTKLMTSIVGNVAPDAVIQDRFSVSDWASRGAFRSLSEYIERDKDRDPLCPRPEQYYEAAWNEGVYGGQVYAIPIAADDRILYINRGIFRSKADELHKAGLDPEGTPRTWSEILAYSKALTEFNKDGTIKRAGFMPNFGNSWLYMYAFQMNGNFMSADGSKCTLYTPATEKALQFMLDGYKVVGGYEKARAFESGFQQKMNDAFIIGKVAMKIDGDWILKDLARYAPQLQVDSAPPPVPDDRFHRRGDFANEKDTFITWFGGFAYAIPKGARNPDLAWEYIKFATSTEGRLLEYQAQASWERLRGRIYIPAMAGQREANERSLELYKPPIAGYAKARAMHVEMAKYGRGRPPTFVAQTLWNEHVRAMEIALYGKASPKDALLTGQASVQRELDAYYEKDDYPVIDANIAVWITLGVIVFGLAAFIWRFRALRLGRLERNEARWAYLFISPWVIGFLIFTLGPMIASLIFSFTQYDVLNPAHWVGLKNYRDLFDSDREAVVKAFGNSLYLAGVGVPLGIMAGLSVALLLNAATRGMRFYRTFFYLPAVMPVVASAVLWTWVLSPDPNKGLINGLWRDTISDWLGLAPPAWLNSAEWSKPALIIMGLWAVGGGMVLWLAGLKGVPRSLYEAAEIDGANPNQLFFKITFPQMSSIIFFSLVMGFIGAMQEFDRPYIMKPASDGLVGPDDSMLTPVYMLFNNGFKFFKMGYASAIAWLVFLVIVLLTAVQFYLQRRWVHYEEDR